MTCSKCNGDSTVTETRKSGDALRRRRKCLSCGHRWTTMERDVDGHAIEDARLRKSARTIATQLKRSAERVAGMLQSQGVQTHDQQDEADEDGCVWCGVASELRGRGITGRRFADGDSRIHEHCVEERDRIERRTAARRAL